MSISVVALIACMAVCSAHASLPHITTTDRATLKAQFTAVLGGMERDVGASFHALHGLQLLGEKPDDKLTKAACNLAETVGNLASEDSLAPYTMLYHATGVASLLDGCKVVNLDAAEITKKALSGGGSMQDIYFSASALNNLKLPLDKAQLAKTLAAAVAKDDSASGLAYAINTAAEHLDAAQAKPFFARIEDLVGQADEVDGKYLQFDGGLSVTAFALSGIYAISAKVGSAPAIKAEEVTKFAAYLLARRTPRLAKQSDLVLTALHAFTTNKYQVPISVQLSSNVAVTSSTPTVIVSVSNVLGGSLGTLTVTADSVTNAATKATVVSKAAMGKHATGNTLYELKLNEGSTQHPGGFYTLLVSAASASDKRLVGTTKNEATVKVVVNSNVVESTLWAHDRDSATAPSHSLTVSTKFGKKLELDRHHKIGMRFKVVDKSSQQPVIVHQTFVVFTHKQTQQEIVFIAEPDAADKSFYKFETDLTKSGKDFDNLSGDYTLRLIVGDAFMQEPLDWTVADVSIKFSNLDGGQASNVNDPMNMYKAKKEEKHTFAVADARPSRMISDVFAIACAAPILIAIVGWLAIGINFELMPASPYTIGFHAGLAGILYLFFTFWVRLDMFTTLKYLSLIGTVTFVCGNRMLAAMAAARKEKVHKE